MHRTPTSLLFLLTTLIIMTACANARPSIGEFASPQAPSDAEVATPVAGTAPITDLVIVAPWTPEGLKPEFVVSEELTGTCFGGALTAGRVDAWRCAVDRADESLGTYSQLLDPCLENPFDPESALACLSPDGQVVLLTLAEPLPRAFANPADQETLPVSLVLDSGDECDLATGATITVDIDGDRQRVNYLCRSGGVLIGEPDKSGAIWTIKYSADPRAEGDILTMGIARAFAFRGDTGNVGWSSPVAKAGNLEDVRLEAISGGQRIIFDFGDGPLPGYDIGYVRERVLDETETELALDGDYRLRVWFHYPPDNPAGYTRDLRRIRPADPGFLNEVLLARRVNGDMLWYLGLEAMSGFRATRDTDNNTISLDIYQPEPHLAGRLDLGVGSEGPAVRFLQEKLVAGGYLDSMPEKPLYDEPTRRAVVALQQAYGFIPDGVAGPAVWAALDRPLPPPRAESSGRHHIQASRLFVTAQEDAYVTPIGLTEVYVRSGPGLNFPPVGSLLPGETAEIIGQRIGSDPTTSWWEICCVDGQSGWVRADVVTVVGTPGELAGSTPSSPPTAAGIRPGTRPSQTASDNPILYFTFDDGPQAGSTKEVAAIVEANNGRGTFFAIGRQVDWTPQITASVSGDHSVQNHTYNHAALDTLSRTDFFNEVEKTQVAIQQATGILPTCLRPPYGATDDTTFQMAAELGLDIVLWTVDTQDWRMPGVDAIVNHILTNAAPGAIILMHDGGGDRTQTIEALQIALPQLRQQGYVFEALCG